MNFSRRIKSIEASKTASLSSIIADLERKGEDVIKLNVGEPDFHTPELVKTATIKAINDNQTKYGLVPGVLELREKIAEETPFDIDKENVLIANGSKQIIFNVFQALIDPLDEVLVMRPFWVTIPESIKLAGGIPIYVDTKNNHIDFEKLENAVTDKTKAIIINSPNNPTGAVYSRSELENIALLAKRYDLAIISDEAYDALTYFGNRHHSIGFLSNEIFKRTITIKTFSKTYSMTGFRVGYMIAPTKIIHAVNKLQSHFTGNNCTFAQYGALAALNLEDTFLKERSKVFEHRAQLAYELFSDFFDCQRPEGAFYLFCDIKKHLGKKHQNCEEFTRYLLKEAGVALVPGEAFGSSGYLRLSFATSEENLKAAHKRIKEIL